MAVVVPQSQADRYGAANPGVEIIPIPDVQDGNIALKRNAILDLIRAESDQTGYMVDDDVRRLVRSRTLAEANEALSRKSAQEVYDLETVPASEAVQAMQELAQKALSEGAVHFGFNNTRNYRRYDPSTPFSNDLFFTAVLGFIARPDTRFDESFIRGSGIDFVLRHRGKVLRDNRYAIDRERLEGGISVKPWQRREDFKALENKWGSSIIGLSSTGYGVVRLDLNASQP
jgi:hypothetical protein